MSHFYLTKMFPPTRDAAQTGESGSRGYSLLEQAGFIQSAGASGIHSLMPLGFRTHERIKSVVYNELEAAGGLNVQMPILHPRDMWEQSGRWAKYTASKTMFTTTDEHRARQFGLAPTAEEIMCAVVAANLRSFRQLPLLVHQIGSKFRAEPRPHGGLLRCIEFSMSDAYSFDRDEQGMRDTYDRMIATYERIFARVGIEDVICAQADSGPIGGSGSAEFICPSDIGEGVVLTCPQCGYAATVERSDSRYAASATTDGVAAGGQMMLVRTPGVHTIAELCDAIPGLEPTRTLKTLVFVDHDVDYEQLTAVCVRGDLDVSEARLAAATGRLMTPASTDAIRRATGVEPGSLGPIDLDGVDRVLFDESVADMHGFACGANRTGAHLVDVDLGRDLPRPSRYVRVHAAADGHSCPACPGVLVARHGIELGHVFQLQQTYAEPLGVTFVAETGALEVAWMGCYGIGTTRLVQAIAEQQHDSDGLIWPTEVAPYDVHLVLTRPGDPATDALVDEVLQVMDAAGLSAAIDDRDLRPGRKFADADLIGCPTRITIGRGAAEGLIEVKRRACANADHVTVAEFAATMELARGVAIAVPRSVAAHR